MMIPLIKWLSIFSHEFATRFEPHKLTGKETVNMKDLIMQYKSTRDLFQAAEEGKDNDYRPAVKVSSIPIRVSLSFILMIIFFSVVLPGI